MRDATLIFLVQGNPIREILLGYKKIGFAQGKVNGFGGKVEAGETIEHATVRELKEEAGVTVAERDLVKMAHLTFTFPARPDWDQVVHVFLARRWQGEPIESNEMRPAWHKVSEIPFADMWQDDPHWLPRVLAGQPVQAWFTFGDDNETVVEARVEELPPIRAAVVISANAEWRAVRAIFSALQPQSSPLGDWFTATLPVNRLAEPVIFFHGGWGKIAAAASAQYVLDRWSPQLLVNLGTCGGFKGEIEKSEIVLVERTIVYDIVEQMTDPRAAIAHFSTEIDLAWLGADYPQAVRRTLLVSGDRDLVIDDIPRLKAEYGAVAGDWESGAIAWVAARNATRCLILRGVTDLVGAEGGEAYDGNLHVFEEGANRIMRQFVQALPAWLAKGLE